MALISVTGAPEVLAALPATATFPLAIARSTARDNGDGTWSVTSQTDEENLPALADLGCTVEIVISDADQLARWLVLESQIDDDPAVA